MDLVELLAVISGAWHWIVFRVLYALHWLQWHNTYVAVDEAAYAIETLAHACFILAIIFTW